MAAGDYSGYFVVHAPSGPFPLEEVETQPDAVHWYHWLSERDCTHACTETSVPSVDELHVTDEPVLSVEPPEVLELLVSLAVSVHGPRGVESATIWALTARCSLHPAPETPKSAFATFGEASMMGPPAAVSTQTSGP